MAYQVALRVDRAFVVLEVSLEVDLASVVLVDSIEDDPAGLVCGRFEVWAEVVVFQEGALSPQAF